MSGYGIVEIFATLQGEGAQAGTPAVFVRFAGCNLWSGHDAHRQRDADAHGARCPLFCDTDFRRGSVLGAQAVAERARDAAGEVGMQPVPLVVLTGGEPLLQIDEALTTELREALPGARLAVETNGTVAAKPGVALDWICVSPKLPPAALCITRGDELKVVVPDYDPLAYESIAGGFAHRLVQPAAATSAVGESELDRAAISTAVDFCQRHPSWRLSMQLHKILGLR